MSTGSFLNSLRTSSLTRSQWTQAREAHRSALEPIVRSHLERRIRGGTHAVYDFLFSYYSFSTGQLLRWTPGVGTGFELEEGEDFEWPEFLQRNGRISSLNTALFPARRVPYLSWAMRFLQATGDRPPAHHCFGLHEWAMVYQAPARRHPSCRLRVPEDTVREMVEAAPLRCTHYDAYRFFSEAAAPLNRLTLSSDSVTENDQPGCIHVTMDLYRFGYKIAPFTPADLLRELFFLARQAREIDMRASPYDLAELGFAAIPIETREGREEYVREQRLLTERARPLRARLLRVYATLFASVQPNSQDAEMITGPAYAITEAEPADPRA